jgi:hypothetical protein
MTGKFPVFVEQGILPQIISFKDDFGSPVPREQMKSTISL